MNELASMLESMTDWRSKGIGFALATVVGTKGSTYRGLGARQLIGATGAAVGTISGGCLDNDLTEVALQVIEAGVPRLVEFDLTADDEAIWGWGIGCNGATRVLVEPADSALELLQRLDGRRSGRALAIAHRLDGGPIGDRFFSDQPDGHSTAMADVFSRSLHDGRHTTVELSDCSYMIEVVGTVSRLVVCGAGHDVDPVLRFGRELGFHVTLTDDRHHLLVPERFPDEVELVHAQATELASVVHLDQRTYVVLMSHNYVRDLEYLRQLATTDVAYVGALGPAERLDRLITDLERDGVQFDEKWKGRLWGPAGLDVGADGPVEIAWSVMSEILAIRSGRNGGQISVRKRSEPQSSSSRTLFDGDRDSA